MSGWQCVRCYQLPCICIDPLWAPVISAASPWIKVFSGPKTFQSCWTPYTDWTNATLNKQAVMEELLQKQSNQNSLTELVDELTDEITIEDDITTHVIIMPDGE